MGEKKQKNRMHNAKMLLLVAGFAALVKAVYLAMDETAPSREFSISGNKNVVVCCTESACSNHPLQFC